jgi:haloacetate dehalogenase
VAHRLALDHPARVRRLCVIDIAPTLDMYARTDFDFARAYYHWFHLIQPAPLPELMIGGNPRAYLHAKLGGWGSGGLGHIEPARWPSTNAASAAPRRSTPPARTTAPAPASTWTTTEPVARAGHKIACDTLVLWGEHGVVQRMFEPLALWQAQCAGQVTGRADAGGAFHPGRVPPGDCSGAAGVHGLTGGKEKAFRQKVRLRKGPGNTLAFTDGRTSVRCTFLV